MDGSGLTAVRLGEARGAVTEPGVAWRMKKVYPYMPSPILHDGVLYTLRGLYIASNECKVSVVRTSAPWEMLAVNELNDECFATPAIAGGRLFIRTRTALYAFAEDIRR